VGKSTAIAQYLEALIELVRARVLLRRRHFSSWSQLLGEQTQSTLEAPSGDRLRAARNLCARVDRLGRKLGNERATCLVKAVAAKRMLARRSIPATIRLGINHAVPAEGASWEAHAWMEIGDKVVLGANAGHPHVPFDRFARSSSGPDH